MPDTPQNLSYRLARMETEMKEAKVEIEKLREEAAVRERNMFKAGIAGLGLVVTTLIGILWANLGTIMPGR
jgi:hypothetical protein